MLKAVYRKKPMRICAVTIADTAEMASLVELFMFDV